MVGYSLLLLWWTCREGGGRMIELLISVAAHGGKEEAVREALEIVEIILPLWWMQDCTDGFQSGRRSGHKAGRALPGVVWGFSP
jgi:hypothetical protein